MPVWRNHSHNQASHVVAIRHPATVDELQTIVRDAEAAHQTVRAVGDGHAWSNVALTRGIVVSPSNLSGLLELDDGTLQPRPSDAPPLVRVRGGTHLKQLNELLESRCLGLRQMGGYDAQTIAGVVSTSTHGSGLGFAPFPDVVRSLDLVIARGERIRVEPVGGITAPVAFAAAHGDGATLIQDDDMFASAICGVGTLGIIAALVIEVRERFWLKELRTVKGWEQIRETVTADGALGRHEHYEIFLNPYRNADGTHHGLVTTRTPCAEPADGESPGRGLVHPLVEMESGFPGTWLLLRLLARWWPRMVAKGFDGVLDGMQEPHGYTSISYKVFNIGEANHLPAYSMELGFTLADNRHLEAVDRILAHAEMWSKRGVWHTSPISLRFVAPSRAYASMMFDQPTMMVELIMIAESRRGQQLLASYEQALNDLGVRPHWGQINHITAERAAELYPRWETWRAVEAQLNATGVFDAPFTETVGIR